MHTVDGMKVFLKSSVRHWNVIKFWAKRELGLVSSTFGGNNEQRYAGALLSIILINILSLAKDLLSLSLGQPVSLYIAA